MPDRANEIDPNPYAASAVAEPYDRCAPTEVGLWRDGQLVVMHVDARWPAICVKTGEPAVGSHAIRITRMVPGSWWRSEQIYVTVRLGPHWYWLVSRFRWAVYAAGAASIPGVLLFLNLLPGTFPLELTTCAVLGTVMAILIGGSLGDTVVLKRSRGCYLWLAGGGSHSSPSFPRGPRAEHNERMTAQLPRPPHSSATSQPHTIDPNPYAPSAVVEPYDRREYEGDLPQEVGLWRDGQLVVMHVEAAWPAICVKTGEPAAGWHTVGIMRLVPGSSGRHEQIDIPVPLSARWYWLVTRLRWPLYAVGVLLIPASVMFLAWHPGTHGVAILLTAMIVSAFALIVGGLLGETVVFSGNRGNYIWLSGAGKRFLAQLPLWPSG